MDNMTLENVAEVKRVGKIARKIYYTVKIANREVTLPLEKGAFLKELKPVADDALIIATFDGQDLTIEV